jgi:PKD repeat protein
MKKQVLIALFLLVTGWLYAQNVTKLEHFFDNDPGYGQGTVINLTSPLPIVTGYELDVSTDGLSNGLHRLFIRSMDDSSRWGATMMRTYFVNQILPADNPYTMLKLQYFLNTDPGYGQGTIINLSQTEMVNDQFVVDVSDLPDGFNRLFIRTMDSKYSWSVTHSRVFFKNTIITESNIPISRVEYFIDTDPGYGSGLPLSFTAGASVVITDEVEVEGLSTGFHRFFVRAKDQNGKWSVAHSSTFFSDAIPSTVMPNIAYGEYFLNTDPGYGNANSIPISSLPDISDYQYFIPLTGVIQGFNRLFVRFRDSNGKWSHAIQRVFFYDALPQTVAPNITYGEYFINSDTGYGNGTSITNLPVGSNLDNIMFEIPLADISAGFNNVYYRFRDAEGEWSQTIARNFYKDAVTSSILPNIKEVKYFIGQAGEVNLNSGTVVADFNPTAHLSDHIFEISMEGYDVGNYYLYAIAKDIAGKTSHMAIDSFRVCDNVAVAYFTYTVASRTVTFTDLSQLAFTYSWNFGDGTGTSTESDPEYTYDDNGSFNVCLTVSNDCNESTFCDSVEVTYNAPPVSSNFNVNIDEDQNYTFAYSNFSYFDEEDNAMDHVLITVLSLATGDMLKYDGTTVVANTQVPRADIGKLVYTPAANQSGYRGTINFKVHDGISYSENQYTVSFNVAPINDPATFTISDITIEVVENSGTTVIEDWLLDLEDVDSQDVYVSVSFVSTQSIISGTPSLGGINYSDLSFTVNNDITGMAQLRLTVTDYGSPSNNTQNEDFTIEVKPFQAQITANPTSTCTGDEVIFTSSSPTEGVTFNWNFGEGATPQTFVGSQPDPVVYSTSGTKTISLTIQGFDQTDTETKNISVATSPQASYIIGSEFYTLDNDTVFFYNTSIGGALYKWDFGDGTPVVIKTTTEMVKHLYNAVADQTFTPKLTVENGICTDSYEQTITFIDADPPVITVWNFPSTYTSSESKSVSITAHDDNYELRNAKFYYKSISGNQWNFRTINPVDGVFQTTIQETMGDQVGIMYFFDVFNIRGLRTRSIMGYAYLLFENGLEIPNIIAGTTVESYQIFSIPLTLEHDSVASIFEELGDYDDTQWRLFHYTPNKLLEYTKDFQIIEKGKGYWFISRKQVTLNTGVGTTHTGINFEAFVIPLRQGWTQIGNPYIFDVKWSDILAANPSAVGKIGNLRVFNNGNFENDSILRSFRGGFVFADISGIELVIPIKGSSSQTNSFMESNQGSSMDSWKVEMQLNSLNLKNGSIGFGMNIDANKQKDRFDEMTIPRFFNYLEANFVHSEYFYPNFSTDIVPVSKSHVWEFTVETNLMGEFTTLSWDDSEVISQPNSLKLVDSKSHKVMDMKSMQQYTFQYDGPRSFKILYGDQQFLDSALVFDLTVLGDCYPNPFSQKTLIPVYLKGNDKGICNIDISVYSIDGRKVATIVKGVYSQGYHEFEWNVGNSTNGLNPGIYLFKLNNYSDGTTSTKRMVLIK